MIHFLSISDFGADEVEIFAESSPENSYTDMAGVCMNFNNSYCLPICVTRKVILKVLLAPGNLITSR